MIDLSQSTAYTHTQYGRFYIATPQFDIRAIAWSQAQQARYTGHGSFRYDTAQHSVLVSRILGVMGYDNLEFEGLMHDGPEAVIADVASPYKKLIPDYRGVESWLDSHMRLQYGLPQTEHSAVKNADIAARLVETPYLLPEQGKDFDATDEQRDWAKWAQVAGLEIRELPWQLSRDLFLERYYYLKVRDGRQINDQISIAEG